MEAGTCMATSNVSTYRCESAGAKTAAQAAWIHEAMVTFPDGFSAVCRLALDSERDKGKCKNAALDFIESGKSKSCFIDRTILPTWPLTSNVTAGQRNCWDSKNHDLDQRFRLALLFVILGPIAFCFCSCLICKPLMELHKVLRENYLERARDKRQPKTAKFADETGSGAPKAKAARPFAHSEEKAPLPAARSRTAPAWADLQLDLTSSINAGAFAQIFVARALDGHVWAVKALDKVQIVINKQQEGTRRQIQMGSCFDHPHVLKVEPGGAQDHKAVYLLMEFCAGNDLFTWMRAAPSPLTADVAASCAAQVLSGIAYLHSLGIMHRNIKPEAVLIAADGQLKIGSLCFLKQTAPGKKTYTLCGTPEYLAPEIILSRGHSTPCDLWSFGCLVYEMLVGTSPFDSQDQMHTYQQIIKGLPKKQLTNVPEGAVRALVKQCIVTEPLKRPTAIELLDGDTQWLRAADVGRPSPLVPVHDAATSLSHFAHTRETAKATSNSDVLKKQDPFAADALFPDALPVPAAAAVDGTAVVQATPIAACHSAQDGLAVSAAAEVPVVNAVPLRRAASYKLEIPSKQRV